MDRDGYARGGDYHMDHEVLKNRIDREVDHDQGPRDHTRDRLYVLEQD